jgi:pyridoxamine 5'-phosphate oxidase
MVLKMPLPWLPSLHAALDAEFGGKPRIAALATADPEGNPHIRHVVVRRVEPDGSLWVASDARSGKNDHLRARPQAEFAFWLPAIREQYRLAGPIDILGPCAHDTRRIDLWILMSDAARGLFSWPPPGTPRDEDSLYVETLSPHSAPPDNFELLVLHPTRVEHLDLNPHPHRRRCWQRHDDWAEHLLNP